MALQQNFEFDRYRSRYENTQGPGDCRPTALEIIQDEDMQGKLFDKVFLVTGCSSGLGVEIARALAHTGAKIVMTSRDMKKGREAIEDFLKDDRLKREQFELLEMHLDSLDSIKQAAEHFRSTNNKLNVLIANAGLGGVGKSYTKDGHEMHFGVNHLAHFLLFELLKDTLISSSTIDFQSRVVAVSSQAHRFSSCLLDDPNFETLPYNPMIAYGSSKTANVWFTNHIERLYAGQGLHGISLHPGGIMTGFQSKAVPEHMESIKQMTTPEELADLMHKFASVEQGAASVVLAAVSKVFEGVGGIYLDECQMANLHNPEKDGALAPGYAAHIFDEDSEKQLWKMSLCMVEKHR